MPKLRERVAERGTSGEISRLRLSANGWPTVYMNFVSPADFLPANGRIDILDLFPARLLLIIGQRNCVAVD